MRLGIDINQLESWSQPHVIMIDCLYFDADFEISWSCYLQIAKMRML